MVYVCILESGIDGTRRRFKSITDARRYAYNRAKRGLDTQIAEESKRPATMRAPNATLYKSSYLGPVGTVFSGKDGTVYWCAEATKGVPVESKAMRRWDARVRIYRLNPDGTLGKTVYDAIESRSRLFEAGLHL